MKLEEAKEILKERVRIDRSLRDCVESDFDEFCENECIAIDTVLKALDNSISKDEVKKAIIDLEKIEKYENHKQEAHYAKICMKELLGEE